MERYGSGYRWWRICQTLAREGVHRRKSAQHPVSAVDVTPPSGCGTFGAHGRARLAQMKRGRRFGLIPCSVQRVSKIGTCFPAPPAYLPIRQILFLASDGNIRWP